MTQSMQIETPEGVTFSFRLASPVARALAWAIDLGVAIVGTQTITTITALAGIVSADWANALTIVVFFSFSIGYSIALEWAWRGQTIGKRLFRLRVVDAQGLRLHYSQVVLRNLLRSIDALPAAYLVGGLAALVSTKAQRLGDLAANTVVILEPVSTGPDPAEIATAQYNSLATHSHLAARLRSRVTPEAAALALLALRRRDGYEPAARVRLFHELAEHFRELAVYPEETTEALTDEQYVRSVLSVLYPAG